MASHKLFMNLEIVEKAGIILTPLFREREWLLYHLPYASVN